MLYILGPLVYNIPNQYQPLFCAKDSNIKNPERSVNWNLSYCKTKKIVYRWPTMMPTLLLADQIFSVT